MKAESIARHVLEAFFGEKGGFEDMTATPERRAAVRAAQIQLLATGEWHEQLSDDDVKIVDPKI